MQQQAPWTISENHPSQCPPPTSAHPVYLQAAAGQVNSARPTYEAHTAAPSAARNNEARPRQPERRRAACAARPTGPKCNDMTGVRHTRIHALVSPSPDPCNAGMANAPQPPVSSIYSCTTRVDTQSCTSLAHLNAVTMATRCGCLGAPCCCALPSTKHARRRNMRRRKWCSTGVGSCGRGAGAGAGGYQSGSGSALGLSGLSDRGRELDHHTSGDKPGRRKKNAAG